ncbi:MAG TPA: FtsK/SpoIIIE domain-containing protein [Anaerolineales bacterium]|nr:FtsK/SpoIIIE domain-containing protein [Anaerolineales bacterium]
MSTNRQFSLALEALAELKTDASTPAANLTPVAPTLGEILEEIGTLPREALLLGVASDGLPILLNLYDSHPGPLIVLGDSGAGKTNFLQTVAKSAIQTHHPNDLQYGVITNHIEEWEIIEETPHSAGVFYVGHPNAQDLILSLATWAHTNKNTRQSVLLLVDGLEDVANLEADVVQSFRWLLLRGPSRRVWPIITLQAENYEQVVSWLQNFRTRIFGHIANEHIAWALGADKVSALNQLEPRIQFSLPENGNWLRFWLPSC